MEAHIETAIRITPAKHNQDVICVQSNVCSNTIEVGNSQCFNVQHALPHDCEQERLFHATVSPLINFLQEGCDVSVVVVGQVSSGKTYTLFGPGFNCASSECDYGIVPRFIRELFARVERSSERHCSISIAWSQICGDSVQDLITCGRIDCKSVSGAFELIQFGLSNIAPRCAHTLFTLTLEQQWLMDNVIQHRMATASFAELASSDKMVIFDSVGAPQTIPSDANFLALQKCVLALTAQCAHQLPVPYHESVLTTLLRDSFGGRAKTLLIGCVSPLFRDLSETFYTLQFVSAAQHIRNNVTVNSFISNGTEMMSEPVFDAFGLKFAANQLLKLVLNAEELFQRLMGQNALRQCDMDQISQWLLLKQECDECLSDGCEQRRSLERIDEEAECSEDSRSDLASDVDTDEDAWMVHLGAHLERFRANTEHIVAKANASCAQAKEEKESVGSSGNSYHRKGARGRRQSIHSTSDLESSSSAALQVASKIPEGDNEAGTQISNRKKQLRQVNSSIQSVQREIGELEQTIRMKESLVQRLRKNQNTTAHARTKIASQLDHLRMQYQERHENEPGAAQEEEMDDIAQKIRDVESVCNVTEDSTRRVLALENSLHTSRKQLDKLRRTKRKDEKKREELEMSLKCSPSVETALVPNTITTNNWLQVNCSNSCVTMSDDIEAVRHEIRNLRRTREFLIEQRCLYNGGASITKIINDLEERQNLQYEEAIEAIDLAIEYKNELMCGHELIIATTDKVSDKILLDRLLKLKENEMRVLLHRYFEKVVDLRYNSKKLEVQLMNAECENEGLLARLQNLSHTLRQVRLESERRIVAMQQQHEEKLHVVMKHIANDQSTGHRVVSRVLERSKQAALSMHVGSASKQVDKSSFIGRFSRYASARHENGGQLGQIQGRDASATHPHTKVTRQKTKLIITQTKTK